MASREGRAAGQRLGVNVPFAAFLLVVLGSMAGQWLSIMHYLPGEDARFYFGHSGYEYIELGRALQIALLIGLFLWLYLVARAIWPALRREDEQKTNPDDVPDLVRGHRGLPQRGVGLHTRSLLVATRPGFTSLARPLAAHTRACANTPARMGLRGCGHVSPAVAQFRDMTPQ